MQISKSVFLILLVLATNLAFSQVVKLTTEFGTNNEELNDVLYFENTDIETLNFEGDGIKGKHYEINIQEYSKGKLIATKQLFDSSESDYFKIDSTFLSFKFFAKTDSETLKTYIKGKRFGSRKEAFKLKKGKGTYVLKSFQGSKDFLEVPLNQEFPILAIITPTIHKDGSGSYCEVAQSEVTPEKFGEKFKIPHYFIITMRFK